MNVIHWFQAAYARGLSRFTYHEESGELGDFTTGSRVAVVSLLALGIGVVAAFVAVALLGLIGFFTNLFFFQRFSFALVSPRDTHLGPLIIVVPVIGGLVIGLMARYGSERIRGHGIPEAIESILLNGSRVQPRLAILKPVSSAIAIGSGGPFGAEGPIIMTGGAFGSLVAQFMSLSAAERKTLLVAGAAAGMSATFSAPVAAVALAVELLLFELKPRSFIPVAIASATAAGVRHYLLGAGPLFPVPAHSAFIGPWGLLSCVLVGLLAGAMSLLLTNMVYFAEDHFMKLPIHWMWWPAIGGLFVGIGGFIYPPALGVGYDVIRDLLQGHAAMGMILGVLLVKSTIWALALGSGTSGGVLAPLLMMGAALGGLESLALPAEGTGFWSLISMGAILGGTMRSPITGVIFAIELTHDLNALLPLLIAVTVAHGFTVVFMRRSILTEKIARRGYHLSREYAMDPLEIQFVSEVMRTNILAIPANVSPQDLEQSLRSGKAPTGQLLYPVVDERGELVGVVTRKDIERFVEEDSGRKQQQLSDLINRNPVVVYPDEPLRVVVYRMAQTGRTRLPVVEREHPRHLLGIVSLTDLLKARERNLEEERHRERVLRIRLFQPRTRELQR